MTIKARRISQGDLAERARWINDDSVGPQLAILGEVTEETTRKWWEANRARADRLDVAFEASDYTAPVAMGGLVSIDATHARSELYVFVRPDALGRGYGGSSVEWLCNYGFGHYDLRKIFLYTMESNQRANNLYRKLGFTLEGLLREHMIHRGQAVNRCVFGLLRHEWKGLSWSGPAILEGVAEQK